MKFQLLLFLCLLFQPLFSQRGVVNYTKENGMISNSLRDVAFDSDGFLWIATDAGIDRFDGQRFTHFQHDPSDPQTICSDNIQLIEFDKKGHVWASTMNNGVIRIDTKTFRVKNFSNDPRNPRSISEDRATAIFPDKNGVLLLSPHYQGLDSYENGRFQNFRPSAQIPNLNPRFADLFSDIVQDMNNPGLLWCASLDGLFTFSSQTKKWVHYPVNRSSMFASLFTGLESAMRCIEQDKNGNLYIGTWGGGLLYFDLKAKKYTRFLFEPIRPFSGRRNNIPDLEWRDTRYLYVCAAEGNFMLFDTKLKKFVRYDPSETVILQPVAMSRSGSRLAVASETSGLYIQNEKAVYGRHVQLQFDIRRMAFHPDGRQWLAVNPDSRGQVLFHNSAGKNRVYTLLTSPADSEFKALRPLYTKKYGWLVICMERILRFDERSGLTEFFAFRDALPVSELKNTVPISLYNEKDSLLWMGTKYGGILSFDLASRRLSVFRHVGHLSNCPAHDSWIYTFAAKGNILYYGHEEGIGAFDLGTRKFFIPPQNRVLSRKQVRTIDFRGGEMWAGTEAEGIFIFDLQSGEQKEQLSERNGLLTRDILKLAADGNGNVWARTARGIAFVNGKDHSVRWLGRANGFTDINDIVFTGDSVYFPCSNGFVRASLRDPLPPDISPRPYIQRVKMLDGSPDITGKRHFDYDENNISFEFGVQDYSGSAGVFVSYRLKGLERNWHSGNNKDEAAYFNLPGGNYEFEVRCFKNGRTYLESYSLSISKPFWTRLWFVLCCIVLLAAAAYLFFRSRIRRVRRQETLRAEFDRQINELEGKALRSQMNPHFLFNSLNSIRLFILKNQVENAVDYISKFSRLLRMILNHSRQDMIPVYDEIQSLKLYLDFERLRFDRGFDYDIEIDGQEVLGYQLPPMIIQPFVENAIWHGLMARTDDGGYVGVSFSVQPGRLYVEVRDNGVGREQARTNNRKASLREGSVGLEITKDRLKSLSKRNNRLNDYEIEDLYDENGKAAGTLIKLYFETEHKL